MIVEYIVHMYFDDGPDTPEKMEQLAEDIDRLLDDQGYVISGHTHITYGGGE